jgi:hypothetical protein
MSAMRDGVQVDQAPETGIAMKAYVPASITVA